MKYNIVEKEVGQVVTIVGSMDEYISLGYQNNSWYYKDSEAFNNCLGVCYITEQALQNFGGKYLTVEGKTFYRLNDIYDTYTYQEFLNLTRNNFGHAIFIFNNCNGQDPTHLV